MAVEIPDWLDAFNIYYFVLVSVVYAILRLNEPVVWATFKQDVTQCCRRNRNGEVGDNAEKVSQEGDVLSDTLNAFLTSSLNVELVYTILKGIRRIVKTPDLEAWKNGQIPSNQSNDFSMRLTLNCIKIRNYRLWEDAHQQQFLCDPNMPSHTKIDTLIEADNGGGEELRIDKKVKVEGHYIHQFKDLRCANGISTQDLLESLDPQRNASCVFKAGEASGASGSFFFFSQDKRFIVKTMSANEIELFQRKLALPYFEYLRSYPTSLLARIYGMYTVKISGLSSVHLMLMSHTMKIERPELVKRVFDLKGSTVDRFVRLKNTDSGLKTLKDENFIKLSRQSRQKTSFSKGK